MTQKIFKTVLAASCFIGLSTVGSSVYAGPREVANCLRNVITQYNDSKATSLICLDQLEADINEGIATGVPLSPATIQLRTEQCQSLEMTREQLKSALVACVRQR